MYTLFNAPAFHAHSRRLLIKSFACCPCQPKLADFGLLRVMEGSVVHSTRVVGTPGYVDPAYVRTSIATAASDVYR